ncbi:hypothetical protein U9M48_021042 [Paspalum notatum var. saurae]|uniref:Uncharacterized protein n=1 Tax=Paspalum notatum var. saurae TaxID=547442 RepID=A0AAQ3WT74_PASNO
MEEPVFAVVQGSPVKVQPAPQNHGQGRTPPPAPAPPQVVQGGSWFDRHGRLLHWIFFFIVGGTFAVLIYLKRDSPREIVLLIVTHSIGTTLGIFNMKLRKLLADQTMDAAELAAKIRRVKTILSVLLVAMGCAVGLTLTFTVHGAAPKVVVWIVAVVVVCILQYFLWFRVGAGRAGRTATDMHELSRV